MKRGVRCFCFDELLALLTGDFASARVKFRELGLNPLALRVRAGAIGGGPLRRERSPFSDGGEGYL
jgi:hypothetical protein